MALPSISETINAIVSSTLRDWDPSVQQQIYDGLPLFKMMKARDKVREVMGGRQISAALAFKANSTFQFYKGATAADTTEQRTPLLFKLHYMRENLLKTRGPNNGRNLSTWRKPAGNRLGLACRHI